LVNRRVAGLVVAFFPAALAAKTAISTIPICFVTGVDSVNEGLVASLNQPGGTDAFFDSERDHIVAVAARHAIPTMYERRETAVAGGLMSYGANVADAFQQAGVYTGRMLKGESPVDLPVLQPTKLEFVINLTTARMLGLTIPPGLLAIADEVVE
jgi:ABC-type uncharacterized transport system substrate-binding protein